MTALALLEYLKNVGVSLVAIDDRLKLGGRRRSLTSELISAVRHNKDELLSLLQGQQHRAVDDPEHPSASADPPCTNASGRPDQPAGANVPSSPDRTTKRLRGFLPLHLRSALDRGWKPSPATGLLWYHAQSGHYSAAVGDEVYNWLTTKGANTVNHVKPDHKVFACVTDCGRAMAVQVPTRIAYYVCLNCQASMRQTIGKQ